MVNFGHVRKGIAFTIILVEVLLCWIAFFAPYWTGFSQPWIERMYVPIMFQIHPLKYDAYAGLHGSCNTEYTCVSGLNTVKDPMTGTLLYANKGWFGATKVLYAIGMVMDLVALVMVAMMMCCVVRCCYGAYHRLMIITTSMAIGGTLFCAIGLGIYGGSSYKDNILFPLDVRGSGGTLSWAFDMGAAGVAIGFVACILLLVDLCIPPDPAPIRARSLNRSKSPTGSNGNSTRKTNDTRSGTGSFAGNMSWNSSRGGGHAASTGSGLIAPPGYTVSLSSLDEKSSQI